MKPTRPSVVAIFRGLGYAALTAVIGAIVALTPASLESLGPWSPILILLARVGEAVLLDRKQPLQAGPLGGSTAPDAGAVVPGPNHIALGKDARPGSGRAYGG